MTKSELIALYDASHISPQNLGKLRRMVLAEILGKIETLPDTEVKSWLVRDGSRLDRAILATAIGFRCERHNINQSFTDLVEAADEKLRKRGFNIKPQTNKEIGIDNVTRFLTFLKERLLDTNYNWPVTDRKKLYHKRIWQFFLDTPIELIDAAPSWFYSREEVKQQFAYINVLIVEDKIKTLSYASECALDEMQDTMTSQQIVKLRQQLNEKKQELATEREERKSLDAKNLKLNAENMRLEGELKQYKLRERATLAQNYDAIKIAGAH